MDRKKFNIRNLSPIKKFLLKKLAKVYGHGVAPARRGLFFSSVFYGCSSTTSSIKNFMGGCMDLFSNLFPINAYLSGNEF